MKHLVHTFLIITFLIGMFLPSHAQTPKYEDDVLYLKNGSVLRGELIPTSSAETITFRLLDGQVMHFAKTEIETLQKESARFRKVRPNYKGGAWRPPYVFRGGYYRKFSFGLASGQSGGFGVTSPYMDISYGYNIHPRLQLGIGTGFHGYGEGLLIPAYLDIGSRILQKNYSPVVNLQAGYSFTMTTNWRNEEFRGGLMLHPSIGMSMPGKDGREIIISLGYRHQPTFLSYTDIIWTPNGTQIPYEVSGNQTFRRITLQFSMSL